MNLYGQAQELTVTAHRSEQDNINGRSLIIVANPVTGVNPVLINASTIRIQFSRNIIIIQQFVAS
jgi:hypothetical protein